MNSDADEIRLLDSELIDKIAAGEVVERPASVVKELVENALDAGSKNISIEVKKGGIELIVVRDDGKGIGSQFLELALTRHATSKISQADDLFAINSLGFRGEALASIASVSNLSIITRKRNSPSASKAFFSKEGALQIDACSAEFGTQIIVENLFEKIPARLAFLKNPSAEFSAIHDYVKRLAMARPDVGFKLSHDQKMVLQVFGMAKARVEDTEVSLWTEESMRQRFSEIYSDHELSSKMLFALDSNEYCRWNALISPPGYEKSNSKFMDVFVNGRWIKDQGLRYALLRGYHSHLLKQKFPIVYMHLWIEPSLVDVNVHPAKTEIRIQYADEVYQNIARGIRNRLRDGSYSLQTSISETGQPNTSNVSSPFPTEEQQFIVQKSQDNRVRQYSISEPVNHPDPKPLGPVVKERSPSLPKWTLHSSTSEFSSRLSPESYGEVVASSELGDVPWHDLKYLGCFSKLYLLFSWDRKLLVVDQHAFHERILYEKLLRDPSALGGAQGLLIPESILLGADVVENMNSQKSALEDIGFRWVVLENNFVEFSAIPSLLKNRDLELILTQSMKAQFLDKEEMHAQLAFTQLATMACHAAVRGGEELSDEQRNYLIAQAEGVDFYHNCPHGRRVFKVFKDSEVARWFDR